MASLPDLSELLPSLMLQVMVGLVTVSIYIHKYKKAHLKLKYIKSKSSDNIYCIDLQMYS